MISTKLLPAFYIVELEGEAANLEFLLGKDFGIEHVRIGSLDFNTDLEATQAGQDVVEYFAENTSLDLTTLDEQVDFNPEFFPTLKPLELTAEQKMLELITQEQAEESAEENQIAVILTRHFDPLGDFVAIRHSTEGGNFKIGLKVAIHPEVYLNQKGASKEAEVGDMARAHRELTQPFILH